MKPESINIRDQVIGIDFLENEILPKGEVETYALCCRYNRQGYIILTAEERAAGEVQLLFITRDFQTTKYVFGKELEKIYGKSTRLDVNNAPEAILVELEGKDVFAVKFSYLKPLLLKRLNDDPISRALYTLGYMDERFGDVDFWLSLKGYRYFTIEGDEPKRLEPISEPQAEDGEQPTETRGQGGLIKVSEEDGKIIVWARAHSVIEIRFDGE